jgi:ABC-type sugar transport system substrate-binding protein
MNQSAPALVGLTKGLQGMAEGNEDIEEILVADPNNDAATQVQQVTAWIDNKQVDAIWFLAINAEAMAPVVERAEAAGVPVIALGLPDAYGYDAPAPGVSFSTIDYEAYGTALGENVANCINDRLDGEGQVVFLQDPAGAVGSDVAADAFQAALAEGAPDAEIVATIDNGNDRLVSQNNTQSALQANPDANVFVAQNDEGTLGALGALTQAGKDPSQLCVAGSGGNDEVLAGVESGDIHTVVALQFDQDLAQKVEHLVELAADPTTEGKQLYVPQDVVTADQ